MQLHSCELGMALYRFIERSGRALPNPDGPLSHCLPSAAIEEANKEVAEAAPKTPKKRGSYIKIPDDRRAEIGRYACENGVANAARKYSRVLERSLNESTVRGIKRAYLAELTRKRKAEEECVVTSLPTKKRGRTLLLGEALDNKVKTYLKAIREVGGALSTAIIIAAARGILLKLDRGKLAEFGGSVVLTKDWAKSLMARMGYVKRRGTTKCKMSADNFEAKKATFLDEVLSTIVLEEIPPQMVFNWDQTGLNLVPSSSWTMEVKGAKRVEIAGMNDKRQITAVFCGTLDGSFLPVQLVYKGKTKRCHPQYKFPVDWHITNSPNHWSNEATMIDYIKKIIVPYVEDVRKDIGVQDQAALAIFDNFRGQMTDKVIQLLDDNNIHHVLVPACCTDRLQPLDVSVNKSVKDCLKNEFRLWYSEQVMECAEVEGEELKIQPINLTAANIKTIGARWIVKTFEHLSENPSIIIN